jgi:hypothetical protein
MSSRGIFAKISFKNIAKITYENKEMLQFARRLTKILIKTNGGIKIVPH